MSSVDSFSTVPLVTTRIVLTGSLCADVSLVKTILVSIIGVFIVAGPSPTRVVAAVTTASHSMLNQTLRPLIPSVTDCLAQVCLHF